MAQGVIHGHDAFLVQDFWHHGIHSDIFHGLLLFIEEPCLSGDDHASHGGRSARGFRAMGAAVLSVAMDLCVAATDVDADATRNHRIWGVDRQHVLGGAGDILFLA